MSRVIHDQRSGEVRRLRKLRVTEAMNVSPGTNAPPIDFYTGWFVYAILQGGLELYPVLNSTSETVVAVKSQFRAGRLRDRW